MFCNLADELDIMTNRVQKVEKEAGSEDSTSTPLVAFQAVEKFSFSAEAPNWPSMHTQ